MLEIQKIEKNIFFFTFNNYTIFTIVSSSLYWIINSLQRDIYSVVTKY